MPFDNENPSDDIGTISEFETQFVSQADDEELLYEVEEITAERGNKYKVRWAGVDPATGKPWPQDWVNKRDCTDSLVMEWKKKNARKKKEASKKRGRQGSDSRSSTKTKASATSSSRKTRQSVVSDHTAPQTLSDDELPVHIFTVASKSSPSTKRKRRPESTEASTEGKRHKDEDEEPPRPRKKRKANMEVILPLSPVKQDGASVRATVKTAGQPYNRDNVSSEDEVRPNIPIKIGPPRGVQRQDSSGKGKGKRQDFSKATAGSHSKTPPAAQNDLKMRQRHSQASITPRVQKKSNPLPTELLLSPPALRQSPGPTSRTTVVTSCQPVVPGPILSPGALARLELFDRMVAKSTDPVSKLPFSKGKGKTKARDLAQLDLPEIAVLPVSASPVVSPLDNLASPRSSPVPVSGESGRERPSESRRRSVYKPVPQISPNTFRAKVKHHQREIRVAADPPPSSIESFPTPDANRSGHRLLGARKLAGNIEKDAFIDVSLDKSECRNDDEVGHDDIDATYDDVENVEEREGERVEMEEVEEEEREEKETVNVNSKRRTDSEVRKRGQEIFDKEQRKWEARRAAVVKTKRLRPLEDIVTKKTASHQSKPTTTISRFNDIPVKTVEKDGSSIYTDGSPAVDGIESVVQEMEDSYVDLNGGTQSVTLETTAPSNIAALTDKGKEAFRVQLRQEEEENTQEAMHPPTSMIQDPDPDIYSNPSEKGGAVQAPNDSVLVKAAQARSQEDLYRASVIVQASPGRENDVDTLQPSAQITSPPREPLSYVTDTPKRRLGEAFSLLNLKSEEIQRLERELAHERRNAENARAELAKIAGEYEGLRSSVAEERSQLQVERMHLETRRIRWTEDRTAWTEELGQWKQARDAWEKQREDWSNQRLEAMKKIPSSSETIESASSEEEKTALKNLEAECKVLTEERDALSRKVSELNSSLESIASAKILVEKDRDFFHEQYAQASSFVGSVRAENSELEERVKIAEGQAQEGVAMIKALFETKVKAFQDDIYRWKTLAEMLQEKDTRTNDDVRERAAQATELESFCKKLLQDNASLETDLRKLGHAHQRVSMQRSKLSRKIISLTKEKAALKGRLAKFSSALEESMKPPKQNHDTSFCGDCESPDPNDMDVMPLSQSILNESSNFDDDAWFYCPWRAKDSELQCSEMFDSKEDLYRHAEVVHTTGMVEE